MEKKVTLMFPTLAVQPPKAVSGKGAVITDDTGKEYLDCSSGVAVAGIGHGVEEVTAAVVEQMNKVSFVYRGLFSNDAALDLSERVIEMSPEGMARVFFCCSGSEGTESAIKIARQYQVERGKSSKWKVISKWQEYHGNTALGLSVSGRANWRTMYDPYLVRAPYIPQCNCYHCPFKLEYPSCGIKCAYELERIIKSEDPSTVSAFIFETIGGATGGCVIPPKEYYPIIREICDKYDVLMIDDEVITGFGRTGKNFAINHYGVAPDLIVTGKGIASGYLPLAGVIVHEKIVDAIEKGSGSMVHSFTYAGHAVTCAAGNAVLKYIEKHDLIRQAEKKGKILKAKLETLLDLPMVGNVRGIGMMLGVSLVKDKETRESYPAELKVATRISQYCFDHGVSLLNAQQGCADTLLGDAMMVTPPFVITEEQMDKLVATLKEAILDTYEKIKQKDNLSDAPSFRV